MRPRGRVDLRQPDAVRPARGLRALPARRGGDLAKLAKRRRRPGLGPRTARDVSARLRHRIVPVRRDRRSEVRRGPIISAASPRWSPSSFCKCVPDVAVFGEKDYQQLVRHQAAGARSRPPGRDRRRADRARGRRPRALLAQRLSLARAARAAPLPATRPSRDGRRRRRAAAKAPTPRRIAGR